MSDNDIHKLTNANSTPESDRQSASTGSVDYRKLFENSIEMVLILKPALDADGILIDAEIMDANPAFSLLTGISHAEASGKQISQILPPEPQHAMTFASIQADIEAAMRGHTRRGEIFWSPSKTYFLYQVFPINRHLVAVVGVDVTLHKEALKALQEQQARLTLSEERAEQHTARLEIQHKMIESREAERQAIANNLHEGLLQALIGMRYAIEEGLNIEDKERRLARLAAVQAMLQREIQNLRDYCNELRPPTLAPFGLEKTIRAHVETYQKKHSRPTILLDLSPDRQVLPDSIRLVLYRVFQHMFKGVVTRPEVRQLQVRFTFDESQATLEMQDDGDGARLPTRWFDLAQQEQIELAGALERVEGIGGLMEFRSLPEKGTIARVSVPLKIAA